MKSLYLKFNPKPLIVTLYLLVVCGQLPVAQQQKTETCGWKANLFKQMVNKIHVDTSRTHKQVSDSTIIRFIESVDPLGFFFTAPQVTFLKSFTDDFNQRFVGSTDRLVDTTTLWLHRRLQEQVAITDAFMAHPDLTFDKKEWVEMDRPCTFVDSEAGLNERWKGYLKHRILQSYLSQKADSTNTTVAALQQLWQTDSLWRQSLHHKVQRNTQKWLNDTMAFTDYMHAAFINALAYDYDPHTNYFSPKMQQEFAKSLSREQFGFGFTTVENKLGELTIAKLQTGSPAWLSEAFEEGDVLMKVKPDGKKVINLSFYDNYELSELLKEEDHRQVEFTLRKKDGRIVQLALRKDRLDSGIRVRGFVLKGEKKVGYITIPSFYSNMEDIDNTGCSLDLMREVVKLKADSVQGLVLDLRNNGGGSIVEMQQIASVFISQGIFAQLNNRSQALNILKYSTPGVSYGGPLAVLVDQNSASASELLTGILMMYNRAVVAGAKTFGKFTSQIVVPVSDHYIPTHTKNNANGYAKITVNKIHLANGINYQGTGITPHIQLPFLWNLPKWREGAQSNALPADTVISYASLLIKDAPLPVKALQDSSAIRYHRHKSFEKIRAVNQSFHLLEAYSKQAPLHFETAFAQQKELNELFKMGSQLFSTATSQFSTINTEIDKHMMPDDAVEKEINKRYIQNINKDIYIEEMYLMMTDLIELQNKMGR